LKIIIKKYDRRLGVGYFDPGYEQVAGCSGNNNEFSGFIKIGKLLHWLRS
jgi:hypothetical protein